MNKKILITGGTGYIGSHTTVELLNAGYTVEILDNLYNSKKSVLDKIETLTGVKPAFYNLDLRDRPALEKLLKENRYDSVIHFAGLKAVAESVEKPLEYYENNVVGTLNLLEAMKLAETKELIFSSSATVYGTQPTPKYTETMPTGSGITNPYGRTKYMIEEILKDVAASDKSLKFTILRYFNPVGNHPSGLLGEDPNGRPNNLMPIIMKVAEGKIEKLSVYGDDYPTKDGSCLRDYIHVVDLAKGHLAALKNQKPGVKVYNLGSGKATSVFEMIKSFEKASNKPLPYEIAPRREGDLPEMFADPEKAKRELNWQTSLTVEDAMRDTLKYLSAQS